MQMHEWLAVLDADVALYHQGFGEAFEVVAEIRGRRFIVIAQDRPVECADALDPRRPNRARPGQCREGFNQVVAAVEAGLPNLK